MKGLMSAPHKFVNFIFKNFFCPRSDIRRLLYFLSFVFIFTPSSAGAAQVGLSWEKSTGPDITGYKMHYGKYSGNYQYTVDVGNSTSCNISGLNEGTTYYFAATAYNSKQQESDYSNEVAFYPSEGGEGIFKDVPTGYWAEEAIYNIFDVGITKGCSQNPLRYCPEKIVTRDQMAIFLLKTKYGSNYTPPPATGIFDDVAVSRWAADWIEQLYREGIAKGCPYPNFCPDISVTRAQMAVFLARTFDL